MEKESKNCATFNASIDELPYICELITKAARESGMEEENLWKLETSVDEACTNIACYSYSGSEEGKIWVHWEQQGDKFVVTLKDEGIPFDQTEPTSPNLSADICQRKAGGLGRYIMSRFLDGMEYSRNQDKNTLILTKKINSNNHKATGS